MAQRSNRHPFLFWIIWDRPLFGVASHSYSAFKCVSYSFSVFSVSMRFSCHLILYQILIHTLKCTCIIHGTYWHTTMDTAILRQININNLFERNDAAVYTISTAIQNSVPADSPPHFGDLSPSIRSNLWNFDITLSCRSLVRSFLTFFFLFFVRKKSNRFFCVFSSGLRWWRLKSQSVSTSNGTPQCL